MPDELREAWMLHTAGFAPTWSCLMSMPAILRDDIVHLRDALHERTVAQQSRKPR